ncbi:MAG: hypothetical protein IK088_06405 [Lachnospiraceae bacterium]|nr:hypothetical protein [Lachnospiraceae bacterium]
MKKRTLFLTLAALVLLAAAFSVILGVSFGRTRKILKSAGQVRLEYGYRSNGIHLLMDGTNLQGESTGLPVPDPDSEGETVTYLKPAGWTYTADAMDIYQIRFLLANFSTEEDVSDVDQDAYLTVFVTEAIAEENAVTIQLETEGGSYIAAGTEVPEGSSMYKAYGKGRVYRFLGRGGDPIGFRLPKDTEAALPMKLTVWGTTDVPSGVTLIAEGMPVSD